MKHRSTLQLKFISWRGLAKVLKMGHPASWRLGAAGKDAMTVRSCIRTSHRSDEGEYPTPSILNYWKLFLTPHKNIRKKQ